MAAKKATLDDVLAEVKEIKQMQVAQGKDIETALAWQRAEDAYRAALAKVRQEDRQATQDATSKAWLKVVKELYPILVIVAAILYAYAQAHGVK